MTRRLRCFPFRAYVCWIWLSLLAATWCFPRPMAIAWHACELPQKRIQQDMIWFQSSIHICSHSNGFSHRIHQQSFQQSHLYMNWELHSHSHFTNHITNSPRSLFQNTCFTPHTKQSAPAISSSHASPLQHGSCWGPSGTNPVFLSLVIYTSICFKNINLDLL